MSKKIIAGLGVVAGLAVALAPVASFATGQNTDRTVVDNLEVTIESSCAFGHDFSTESGIEDLTGVTRTDGTAEWGTVVYSVGLVDNQDAGTYEGSMTYTLAEVQGS